MGNNAPTPPPITDIWKWLGFHFTKDWREIVKYPIALLAVFIFTIAAAWLLTWHVVVPEKDEQLSTKQGTIDNKQSLIDVLQQKLESKQQEVDDLKSSHTNYYAAVQGNSTNREGRVINNPVGKPEFDVYLNNEYITNGEVFNLNTNGDLFFQIFNVGTEDATNLLLSFFSPFAPTNFVYDKRWNLLRYTDQVAIGHRLYDYYWTCTLAISSGNPIPKQSNANGFDATTFNVLPSLKSVLNPVDEMRKFGLMQESNIAPPSGPSSPARIRVWSSDSVTNEYYIFLKLNYAS